MYAMRSINYLRRLYSYRMLDDKLNAFSTTVHGVLLAVLLIYLHSAGIWLRTLLLLLTLFDSLTNIGFTLYCLSYSSSSNLITSSPHSPSSPTIPPDFSCITCFWIWQELIKRWDSECELFNDDIAHTQAYFKIPEKTNLLRLTN